MRASFIDFRRKPGHIIKALASGQEVQLYYRGSRAGVISPTKRLRGRRHAPAKADPARGIWADRPEMQNPTEYVRRLRQGRFDAL